MEGAGDYYLLPVRSGVEQLINPYLYPVQGVDVLITSLVVPIRIDSRSFGITGVDLRLDGFQDLIDGLSAALYEGKAEVNLISYDGTLVALSGNPDASGKPMADYHDDWEQALEYIRSGERIAEESEGIISVYVPIRVGATDTPWGFHIEVPESIVTLKADALIARRTLLMILVLSILSIAAGIILMIFRAGAIARPVEITAGVLADIAEGEGDLTKRIQTAGKDETAEMAKYFNLTMDKIEEVVASVRREAETLFSVGSELSSNMTETAAAVKQITVNIEKVNSQTIEQSAGVTEANATVEQIVTNLERFGLAIEEQAAGVTESSASIVQMVASIVSVSNSLEKNAGSVASLRRAAEQGREGSNRSADLAAKIARDSDGLLEASGMIKAIAEQTNLLAMNAVIEAAHAGEAGKGFAVVADEIRKLAENAGAQAKTITEVLEGLKTSIDSVNSSTADLLTQFENVYELSSTVNEQELLIKSAMEEQNKGGQQVLEALTEINAVTSQVKDDALKMLSGSREVLAEMRRLSGITHEIAGGMNEMASGAEQITHATSHVAELSVKNGESITKLTDRVRQFKIGEGS